MLRVIVLMQYLGCQLPKRQLLEKVVSQPANYFNSKSSSTRDHNRLYFPIIIVSRCQNVNLPIGLILFSRFSQTTGSLSLVQFKVCLRLGASKLVFAPFNLGAYVVIRALLTLKIRTKNAVLDPVNSRKMDLRREEMFRCLSSLMSHVKLELSLGTCFCRL